MIEYHLILVVLVKVFDFETGLVRPSKYDINRELFFTWLRSS
jgi:hypothetical protein